jgi:hypothetical protein
MSGASWGFALIYARAQTVTSATLRDEDDGHIMGDYRPGTVQRQITGLPDGHAHGCSQP